MSNEHAQYGFPLHYQVKHISDVEPFFDIHGKISMIEGKRLIRIDHVVPRDFYTEGLNGLNIRNNHNFESRERMNCYLS